MSKFYKKGITFLLLAFSLRLQSSSFSLVQVDNKNNSSQVLSKKNIKQNEKSDIDWFKSLSPAQKLGFIAVAGFVGIGLSSSIANLFSRLLNFKIRPLEEESDYKFFVEEPNKSLEKLIVPETTKKEINHLLTKIKHSDVLYNDFGFGENNNQNRKTLINFYGPPGTGKSFAAEAIAHELGKKIVRVNYAGLESVIVGQTAKNIKEVFEFAKRQDVVLIFDEADAILGKRLADVTRASDYEVNKNKSVLLCEMDRFSGIVIFTTNFGENYDPAFVRRIIGHVKFELPDSKTRKKLFENLLPNKLKIKILNNVGNKLDKIIEDTDGFSGGDLSNMIMHAALSALTRDGKDCELTYQDFKDAITTIQKSKQEIGVKKNK